MVYSGVHERPVCHREPRELHIIPEDGKPNIYSSYCQKLKIRKAHTPRAHFFINQFNVSFHLFLGIQKTLRQHIPKIILCRLHTSAIS